MNDSTTYSESDQDSRQPEQPFVFKDEYELFKTLHTKHIEGEQAKCKIRREARRNRVDIEAMKKKNADGYVTLLPDETFIPDRTIETNIGNEKPAFIAYIEQPQTVVSFSDPAQASNNFSQLSAWVTDLCRYQNWKTPWLKLVDSILLHGAGALEVVFNPDMPGKFVIEYIKRDDLIFPARTTALSSCSRFARRYQLTKLKFDEFVVKYQFDPVVAKSITDHYKQKEEFIEIYKYYLRGPDNVLYNAWMAQPNIGTAAYLREPETHFLGDFEMKPPGVIEQLKGLLTKTPPQPLPVKQPTTVCPIVLFPYNLEEDEEVQQIQGRAALDIHTQCAVETITTATANGTIRASKLYPYAKPGPTGETEPIEQLIHGAVHKGDMGFIQTPWPTAISMSVAQALSTRNAAQTGSVDYAAMTRQDTAKRAAEIYAAQNQADQLKSTKISLFAQSSLELYTICWSIIKNQLVIGGLQLPPLIPSETVMSASLTLVMSADAQVVRKAMLDAKFLQYYGLVSGTKLQDPYFRTMIQRIFPDEYPAWEQASGFITAQDQVLAAVMQMMMTIPEQSIPAEMKPQFLTLLDQIQSVIAPAPQDNEPAAALTT